MAIAHILTALTLCARWRYRFATLEDQDITEWSERWSTPRGTWTNAPVADGVLVGLSTDRSIINLVVQ
jgi:hypothetical protein